MGRYADLVAEFFTRYERPEIEELIVGFSGIDPPLKNSGGGTSDHEELDNLLGGDENGHYHLTKDLWLQVLELLSDKDYDGGWASTPDSEYQKNYEEWFSCGFAGTTEEEYAENTALWQDGGGAQW